MAPPAPSKALPITGLVLRLITFVFLIVSLILIVTNTATVTVEFTEVKIRFKDVYAYRYSLSTSVIGLAYTLLQIPFAIYNVNKGKPMVGNEGLLQFNFYGDKVISSLLATGVGAAFGATVDLKKNTDDLIFLLQQLGVINLDQTQSKLDNFYNMALVSGCLLLLAFLCATVSSVMSSLALSRKG